MVRRQAYRRRWYHDIGWLVVGLLALVLWPVAWLYNRHLLGEAIACLFMWAMVLGLLFYALPMIAQGHP